ncbi:PspC domain-containing protein [Cellulosimicrobium sp. PMB13]|uniref:PspC domain-containing protein n=1 Tax=Cellulosimicrobium sp. PMB13 TaxID=3120158 RepID=UPI003F4C4761
MSTTPFPPEPPGGGSGPSAGSGPDGGPTTSGGPAPAAGPGTQAPPSTPFAPSRKPGAGADGFFDGVRRIGIARSDDRWVGGVAAGVAERFGIDPLLVRGILFVTFFLSGAGLVLYGAAWALLPERRDGRIHLQEAVRGNFDVAMLGAIAAVVVGLSWGGGWWSWWDYLHLGWLTGLFWVAAIVVVAVVAVSVLRRDGTRGGPGTGWSGPQSGPGWSGPAGPTTPGPVPGAPATGYGPADAPWGSPGPVTAQPTTGGDARTADQATEATWTAHASPYAAAPATGATATGATATSVPPSPAGPVPAWAGGTAPRPPAPPVPPTPRPPKPRRPRGPGSATVGIVVGLSLLLGALLLMVERQGDLAWPVFLTWLGGSVVLAGLAIVVSGLRGRTSGSLGWLAVLALLVGVPTAVWQEGSPELVLTGDARTVSDGTHTVVDPDVAAEGFAVRWGDPTIDLSQLDLSDASGASPVEVPVELGAGDVTVIVPDDVPLRAEVQVLAGSARWRVDGEDREIGGVSTRPVTFENAEVDAGEDPLLVLDVVVGAGQVTIEEDS